MARRGCHLGEKAATPLLAKFQSRLDNKSPGTSRPWIQDNQILISAYDETLSWTCIYNRLRY
jgi:hypothetical protein